MLNKIVFELCLGRSLHYLFLVEDFEVKIFDSEIVLEYYPLVDCTGV